ncbi:MAG TPA: hypothetical protein VFB34_08685 [Chloroflexota bacterium]|nr:hypothetical protein [Chloroflexota bacterium]
MDLRFELGQRDSPAGHALVYFTSGSTVLATYVLVLPIQVNLEKYVPPAFASMMNGGEMPANAATPMPPIAEEVESLDWLRSTAESRRDDLVDGGSLYSTDLPNLVAMTHEAAAEYAKLYENRIGQALGPGPMPDATVYEEMSEAEVLREMTRDVGRLRDAMGSEESESIRHELERLAGALPSKYRASEVVEAAAEPGARGEQLATLQLQRCYKLLNEEYLEVADIERQIKELQQV